MCSGRAASLNFFSRCSKNDLLLDRVTQEEQYRVDDAFDQGFPAAGENVYDQCDQSRAKGHLDNGQKGVFREGDRSGGPAVEDEFIVDQVIVYAGDNPCAERGGCRYGCRFHQRKGLFHQYYDELEKKDVDNEG